MRCKHDKKFYPRISFYSIIIMVVRWNTQDLINHTNDTFKIDLRNFPKREPNTTRIQVEFKYIEENKFEIAITDLGFGEFFESSGMVVKKEITLQ